MDEVDLIHRVLCRLDLPDAAVYSSLARLRAVRQTEDSDQIALAFRELLRTFFEAVRLGLGAPEKQEHWIHLRQRAELQDDPDIQAMLDYLIPPYRSPRRRRPPDRPRPDDGGTGVGARRRPRGPGPTLRNEKPIE